MKEIRVRFAPSPTGFLHVGGARTAIFNWLFARNKGGKFLLRIEDTDPERSKSELSEQIIRSMNWLGMEADEPIVYQALNMNRHREVVDELLNKGKAYYAFETTDELEVKRKEASHKKIQYKYDRASLGLDAGTVKQFISEGKPYAVRFKVQEGSTKFDDIVHGSTVFNNSEIEDFILMRSDGSPMYQIAVVVDDHDMRISHVIRGDDHLSNTPKQIMLYEALGWNVPQFAHLPMILDEQKKKLSKRRNPVSVEEYKDKGYLPEALFNFLTLLGFAPIENREVVAREELIKMFSFERVNKKSAVFDMKKLNWINSEYIKSANETAIANLIKEKLSGQGIENNDPADFLYLTKVVGLMKERVSTINDFVEFGKYFFEDPKNYDEKGLAKHWNKGIKSIFEEYFGILMNHSDWKADLLEKTLREFAESKVIKAGELIHILRLSLTGMSISPGIFELMTVLGPERVTQRISIFLSKN